ncbi:MAG: FAD/NAD(P)-binding protein, partial [Candidatus Thermoplasmatota archaeon]
VGVRGPLGHGFDVELMKNKHLLFVSGGIGIFPLRSLIKYVLAPDNRNDYGNVTILYGCKRPCEVLFMDEVKEWEKAKNVTCKLTVDKCEQNECWTGEIGLITTLFPKIKLDKADSKNTISVICGPPIMYKYVIKCLQTLGIPDENIIVSLERRMKCGVGKCGHCQINGVYACKEGPVFNYNYIKNLPEAFE